MYSFIRLMGNPLQFLHMSFDVEVISDPSGYFEIERVYSFACNSFEIEVSAKGYTPQKWTYFPAGEVYDVFKNAGKNLSRRFA